MRPRSPPAGLSWRRPRRPSGTSPAPDSHALERPTGSRSQPSRSAHLGGRASAKSSIALRQPAALADEGLVPIFARSLFQLADLRSAATRRLPLALADRKSVV